MTGPRPDVIIVAERSAGDLSACLLSVREHLSGAPVHVWLNPAADDRPVRDLAAEHPDVDWTFSPVDLGYAAAVNRIVARTGGDTLLLDPEARLLGPLPGTRAALLSGRVAAASPTVLDTAQPDPRDRPWDVAHRRPTVARLLVEHAGHARTLRGTPVSDLYAAPPAIAGGYLARLGLLVGRVAWDEVGPLDERLVRHAEDREWQRRAQRLGWRLALVDEPHLGRAGGARPRPPDRPSDPPLASAALALGIDGNRGPGTVLLGGGLLVDRVARRPAPAPARRPHRVPVVISTPKLGIGGAERQRMLLANELVRRGHPVTMLCLNGLGHLQRELDPDVRVVLRPWWQPVLETAAGTVLVSGTTKIELMFAALWTAAGRRRHWLVAAHDPPRDGGTYSPLVARLIGRSDGVITLSECHWQELTRHQPLHERHWNVPNGVQLQDDRGYRPRRPLRIGFLGRMVEHKNPHLLVTALAELAHLDWQLDLFGGGRDEDRLRARTPDAVRHRVHWRGRTAGPAAALAEMDVLCLPSRAEAFPLVLLEAMACGVPTVANAVCAVPEMLDHGRAGVVVPGTSVADWTGALRTVLDDPGRLATVARAGWERVERHYTVAAMADGYQRVIADAVSE